MEYSEARSTFIERWGEMGTNWGINKTMGQIHALLLVSSKPLCADQIMDKIKISRGNTCMNLKALTEWGLIYKRCKEDCRKEYYVAEKEMFKVFRQIVLHRKRQELDPLIEMLDQYTSVEENCQESSEFCRVIKDIKYFSTKADSTLDSLLNTDRDWFMSSFLRMIK